MLLSCRVKILISNTLYQTHNDIALTLYKKFITLYSLLYGKQFISYNVHSLFHLSMFVIGFMVLLIILAVLNITIFYKI